MFWKGSRFPGLSPAGTTHRLFSLPGSVSRGSRHYPLTPQVKGIPPVMGVSILSIYRPPRGRSHPEKRAGNAAGETQRLPVPLGTRAGTGGGTGVPEGRRLPLQVCRRGEEASETGEHGGRAAGGRRARLALDASRARPRKEVTSFLISYMPQVKRVFSTENLRESKNGSWSHGPDGSCCPCNEGTCET